MFLFALFSLGARNLQSHLAEKGILTRKNAGSGAWVSLLLPLAVIAGSWKEAEASPKFQSAGALSCGLLAHSLLLVYEATTLRFFGPLPLFAASFLSSFILHFVLAQGLLLSLFYGFSTMIMYQAILLPLMSLCPRNFTFGEASVVVQAFVLFLMSCLRRDFIDISTHLSSSTAVLQVGILCILCFGGLCYEVKWVRKPLPFYLVLGLTVFGVLLPLLAFFLNKNPLNWLLEILFEDEYSVRLLLFWSVWCVVGGVTIVHQSRSGEKATTSIRKVFHVLSLLVFLPGLLYKPALLYLASGVVLALFIFIDMLRLLKIPPLGSILSQGFQTFSDEKDEGPFALTPMYLLVGCSLPLWLHPAPLSAQLLPLVSGLLSVGVGDTAASVCGSLVGVNRWPGSKKTKEGTAACFLSQLFSVIALIHMGYVPRTNLIKPTFAIGVTSLVEAKTDQVDNLVLPLLMYNIFMLL